MVRKPNTPGLILPSGVFTPAIGGMKARLPVAIKSLSKRSRMPFSETTTFADRSISLTIAPACSLTSFSSYHSSGLMNISLASWAPERMFESRMRL
jgi:hypothetical protein